MNAMLAPLRILVCDDSVVVRAAMARILATDPGMQVAARASSGREALAVVRRGGIDVVVLDLDLPVMGGLEVLPQLLAADPGVRVIVTAAGCPRGAGMAMAALRLGASDYVPKPRLGEARDFAQELVTKAHGHGALRRRLAAPGPAPVGAAAARRTARPVTLRAGPLVPVEILAIGAATGGPEALGVILRAFRRAPRVPVVLTQHMPAVFIPRLAEHLTQLGPVPVAVAMEGEPLRPGRAYIAPGTGHLGFARTAGGPVVVRLRDSAIENGGRPAVDTMLRSLAAVYGASVGAAILTGSGQDGLRGGMAVAAAGGALFVQDATSAVIWGMPGAVAEAGLAREVLPLPALATRLAALCGAA